jgi:hypothetical protein
LPANALCFEVEELVFGRSPVSLNCFLGASLSFESDFFLSTSTANGKGLFAHDSDGSKDGRDGAVLERLRPTVASAVCGLEGDGGDFV